VSAKALRVYRVLMAATVAAPIKPAQMATIIVASRRMAAQKRKTMIYGKSELAGLNERVHNLSIESFGAMCALHQAGARRRKRVTCVNFSAAPTGPAARARRHRIRR
jgi:hypothetical protein